jgi:hypothetical protein
MAGLVPAIYVFGLTQSFSLEDMDARHKAGHDEKELGGCNYVSRIWLSTARPSSPYGLASVSSISKWL